MSTIENMEFIDIPGDIPDEARDIIRRSMAEIAELRLEFQRLIDGHIKIICDVKSMYPGTRVWIRHSDLRRASEQS